MDLGFGDARAVIVGGSRGMGRAAARSMAAEGCAVAVIARTRTSLDGVLRELRSDGSPEPLGVAADVTVAEDIAHAFDEIAAQWPSINVLVNAVGPVDVGIGGLADIDDSEWRRTFEVGAVGAVRCVRHALPLLRLASWARIVNVSAHSTKRQSPTLVAYTAAKAALTSISKNLAQSLAAEGILVNTVSPGSFLSDGMRHYLADLPIERGVQLDSLSDAMRVIAEDFGHPAYLRRAGDPAEIGPVIAFLASRANSYMTGANVNVDGGSDFC